MLEKDSLVWTLQSPEVLMMLMFSMKALLVEDSKEENSANIIWLVTVAMLVHRIFSPRILIQLQELRFSHIKVRF